MAQRMAQYCDFCGKSEHEVANLILGPKVAICGECVVTCVEILAKKTAQVSPADTPSKAS